MNFPEYFADQITLQNQAISSYKKWIVGLTCLGVLLFFVPVVFHIDEKYYATVLQIAGAAVSLMFVFPYREISARKERIKTYEHMKLHFETVKNKNTQEYKSLLGLAIEIMKETSKR